MSQVEEFCTITGESESVATQYLERNHHDLNAAVNHYFETGGQLPEAPSGLGTIRPFGFSSAFTSTERASTASRTPSGNLNRPEDSPQEQPAPTTAPRVSEIEALTDGEPRPNSQWKAKVAGLAPAKQKQRVDDPGMFLVPPAQKQTRTSFVIRKKDVVPRRPYKEEAQAENPST